MNISTIIERNSLQAFSEIDEEIVMLNIEKGEYLNFDIIGSKIWLFLESPKTFGDILDMLMNIYDVPLETCKNETEDFLNELNTEKLVCFIDAE